MNSRRDVDMQLSLVQHNPQVKTAAVREGFDALLGDSCHQTLHRSTSRKLGGYALAMTAEPRAARWRASPCWRR
jgi:hypothetical protein